MTDSRTWQLLVLVLILAALLWLLAPVLTPFAVAALLAWLGDPLVDRLERHRLSRGAAVTLVFLLMTTLLVLAAIALIPLTERQIGKLIEKLPLIVAWTNAVALPWIEAQFGFSLDRLEPGYLIEIVRAHWQQAGGLAASLVQHATRSGLAIISFIGTLVLIPVVTFYFLRDWDLMMESIRELLPRHAEPTISRLAREADQVLAAFLRGQITVMVLLGIFYSVGLWLVGLDLAFLIGMLAGLVSFVPYLGVIIGGGAAVIAASVEFQDLLHPLLSLVVFIVGQLVESFLLTPRIVGDRVGLHPVAVIFAILAGGALFGFLGVLLALPVAAVGMVLVREAHRRYLASELYGAAATVSGPHPHTVSASVREPSAVELKTSAEAVRDRSYASDSSPDRAAQESG